MIVVMVRVVDEVGDGGERERETGRQRDKRKEAVRPERILLSRLRPLGCLPDTPRR